MPERFLFVLDYEGCDIKEHMDFIDKLDLSDIEKEMVFYNNIKRLYRLDIMEDLWLKGLTIKRKKKRFAWKF